ncbi:MAG: tetratricopeptide repeat protein, partial [Treponema sp.]|nr:tetratricopeptide repeat protein [Treponema sp.]
MNQRSGGVVHFFFLVLWVLCTVIPSACTSTKAAAALGGAVTDSYTASSDVRTPITIAPSVKRGYFYPIDKDIIAAVETGSPASLRSAVASLRRSGTNYEENQKVLLVVAAGIMALAWPHEPVDWDVPAVSDATPYTGALASAQNGIFDESTGNIDFLATVLPALVVLRTASVDEYFSQAEQTLLACTRSAPHSVLAQYLLGILYQKHREYERSLLPLRRAGADDTGNRAIIYAEAVSLIHTGAYDEAQALAGTLLNRFGSDVAVLKLNAELAAAQNDWERAEDYVARVLQQTPNDAAYVLFRARILMERGDYIRAASLLDVYARQDSTSRDYLLLRARLQNDWSRNTAAAIATLETALTRYGNDTAVLLMAAEFAATTGALVGGYPAEELAARVLQQEPDNVAAIAYSVRGMVQAQNWQAAYTASRTLNQRVPNNQAYQLLHVTICLALNRTDEAWTIASSLYRSAPADTAVLEAYITVLAQTGRTASALTLINEHIVTAEATFRSFLFYRRSFLQSTQDDALADLRSSLIANPRNNDALFRLYQIYFEQKEYRRAQYYLRQVVALNPNNATY